MRTSDSPLSDRIAQIPAIDPAAPAVDFEGTWHSWGDLDRTIVAVGDVVNRPGSQVGIILRNRPAHVAALLGVLRAGGCVVAINPHRGVARTRDDIAALGLDTILGTAADLAELVSAPGVRTTVMIGDLATTPTVATHDAPAATASPLPGVAVRMLTSGTTGPPKRVELAYDTLERVLLDAKHYERNKESSARLRSGVVIVNSPLVHLGGLFRILQCINDGRAFCLLEKFTVDGWYDAVRRHRPLTVSLVPAALRMVLDADLDRDELSSIRSVISGTAPLSPDDAEAFYQRYGIPVLTSYAATEFGGGVAGWNLADHEKYWATKRGSVGRAHAGSQLRVVAEADGAVLGPGERGLLEVMAGQLGSDEWIRTTDLASIDDDGFLWIHGRADQAIIRGGFKVLPDDVRSALERHPDVRGAAVVGRPDDRLGTVPVAAVELRPGTTADQAALIEHAQQLLAPYEVPVEIVVVTELPRTDSGKVDLVAVTEQLAGDQVRTN
ncbi:MAG TPA: AMP-binding protein [Microthrixaceae bacterium]|nr:AMP-binding protein [Microthrixaceae bacterium]